MTMLHPLISRNVFLELSKNENEKQERTFCCFHFLCLSKRCFIEEVSMEMCVEK